MIYVGVDSCPYGWIAVIINEHVNGYKLGKTFKEIFDPEWWKHFWEGNIFCLVDIPIGLLDEERQCDKIARSILGPRKSSVFNTPVYDAVYAETYQEAKEANHRLTGKYISKQAWNICNKIKDVNDTLKELPNRIIVKEMHPEVCFWALNDKMSCKHYKKTQEGKEERLEILLKYETDARNLFDVIRNETAKKDVADDDIIDAMVGAITARTMKLTSFPKNLQKDRNGYVSEMVFYNGD